MNRRQFLALGALGAGGWMLKGAVTALRCATAAQASDGYILQVEFGPADALLLRLAVNQVTDPTVLGLLQAATDTLGLRLETADYGPMGRLVTVFGRARNDAFSALYLWRNAVFLGRSAGHEPLQSGDAILVRYRTMAPAFIRGDSNADGAVDVSDVIASLQHKFGGRPSPCPDAADADDDGALTLGDDLGLLRYLFLQGPNPTAPYPYPGPDPTFDALGCRW